MDALKNAKHPDPTAKNQMFNAQVVARPRTRVIAVHQEERFLPHFTSAVTKPRPRYANHPMLRNHFEGNIEFSENVTWITPWCLSLNGYIYIYIHIFMYIYIYTCVFKVLYILTKGLHRSNPTQMGFWGTYFLSHDSSIPNTLQEASPYESLVKPEN